MPQFSFFDSHCHLQDPRFGENTNRVMDSAYGAGVCYMLCCGTQESDWEGVANLARRYTTVLPAFGIHPWFCASRSAGWQYNLNERLQSMPAAVGECGLDFTDATVDRVEQEQVLWEQLLLAKKKSLPVILHCRNAWERLKSLLNAVGPLPAGGMIHSYSGSHELVKFFAGAGFFISFSGSVTYSANRKVLAACRAVFDDKLLIETDSPDILPAGIRNTDGKMLNEPSFLPLIAAAVAGVRGNTVENIAKITCENGVRLWDKILH